MGPVRTAKAAQQVPSSSQQNSKKKRQFHPHQAPPAPQAIPGVQKLKASLRQTRRLLAKDNIAADVRVETERRLKALEADLAVAESSRKEKALASRYHKVKFFERQKVTRKLNQVKHKLSSSGGASNSKIEKELYDSRVDLNYILHYPKTKKYISLFPPEVRLGSGDQSNPSVPESDDTSKQREEVRKWIKEMMKNGELSNEPELHMEGKDRATAKKASVSEKWASGQKKAKGEHTVNGNEGRDDVEGDDFFGDEDEDEDEDSEEEGEGGGD